MRPPASQALSVPGQARRAVLLFTNFLLIILSYYQIKPAARSLFITYWTADKLPYVWITTALVLGIIIGFYHRIVERNDRLTVVLGTLVCAATALVVFRVLFPASGAITAVVFYVFVDIFSVVLVEQFWSLANSVNTTELGKKWYGFIAMAGPVGGMAGSKLAADIVARTPLKTEDLLLVAAAVLVLLFLLNLLLARQGVYAEAPAQRQHVEVSAWRDLLGNRYLRLIAVLLLLSQIVESLVDYQFSKAVADAYRDTDQRTTYLGNFNVVLNGVAIGVNLLATPLVHQLLGVISGLLVQPLLVTLTSIAYMAMPVLHMAAAMKISDRGMSYSINRASKEILYIPIDPVRTYQAKAWIDMFGYRLFKVIGSVLILALTQWFALGISVLHLSYVVLGACGVWLFVIIALTPEYRAIVVKAR
jgi:AAA family ATP:ADP antiporter